MQKDILCSTLILDWKNYKPEIKEWRLTILFLKYMYIEPFTKSYLLVKKLDSFPLTTVPSILEACQKNLLSSLLFNITLDLLPKATKRWA